MCEKRKSYSLYNENEGDVRYVETAPVFCVTIFDKNDKIKREPHTQEKYYTEKKQNTGANTVF
jgi:hypothetical protein